MGRAELVGWGIVGVVLAVFAIPWFLWGDETIVASLPLWLWWHIGWMFLTALVFWIFTKRAWGIGIETDADGSPVGAEAKRARDERGDSP